ncbi:phage baseplate protein [Levilactobacillus tangyuanensis]|uniref:Phage baseplate protein n=1 Tax=Levilactobacillus tangyuanensis TaxID=2486021 RepID=A0ABW1TP30_9LACO|nr:hypothetical protein [Levilactobacillus tangyuanensis]
MASKKTLATYNSAVSKAKTKYNKAKSTYTKDNKAVATLNKKIKSAKTTAAKNKLKGKLKKAQRTANKAKTAKNKASTKYTQAKSDLSSFKKSQAAEKRKATLQLKKDILAKVQKDKPGYWKAGRPLIIPKYPGTINSWVFIDNTSESETSTTDITTNAISPGQYVNHYTQVSPVQHQIDGKLGGALSSGDGGLGGLNKQFDNLEHWSQRGTEVEIHHGQRPTNSAVLTSVAANFDAPRDNALPVSVSAEDVKWAETMVKKTGPKKKNTGPKSSKKGTKKATKPKAEST